MEEFRPKEKSHRLSPNQPQHYVTLFCLHGDCDDLRKGFGKNFESALHFVREMSCSLKTRLSLLPQCLVETCTELGYIF